jgi:thiosulfate reductase cytochrome b subunit
MSRHTVVVYKAFERFWHWLQAVLIFFLGFTGFEIHGAYTFFGFRDAVRYHNVAAVMLLLLIVFAIFWHLTTGEWRQYVPTLANIRSQLNYYLFGIFRNAPHPTKKTVLSKLNPLQKLTYFGLKVLVIPIIVTSGLLYMLYRYPQQYGVAALNIESLELIAIAHTIGAFLLLTFVVAHLYLITTGDTVTSNLKAMLTGCEDLTDHGPEDAGTATPPAMKTSEEGAA